MTAMRVGVWFFVAVACAAVFGAWMSPHLTLEVANFIRSCF